MLVLICIYLMVFKFVGISVPGNLIWGYSLATIGLILIGKIIGAMNKNRKSNFSKAYKKFSSYFLPTFSLVWTLTLLNIAAISWGFLIVVIILYVILGVIDQLLN